MQTERTRDTRDRVGVEKIDQAERKLFELPDVGDRMHLPVDELVDDGAQERRVFGSSPTLFWMHGQATHSNAERYV